MYTMYLFFSVHKCTPKHLFVTVIDKYLHNKLVLYMHCHCFNLDYMNLKSPDFYGHKKPKFFTILKCFSNFFTSIVIDFRGKILCRRPVPGSIGS